MLSSHIISDSGMLIIMITAFRSVSEKEDRPLSRLRPGSAVEERANIKRATRKLSKLALVTTCAASILHTCTCMYRDLDTRQSNMIRIKLVKTFF